MDQLPVPAQPSAQVVRLSDGSYVYTTDPAVVPQQQAPQVIHQHIHQAPPDRTIQRIALGSGVGAGAVGASVYFAPLLIAAITSMAISIIAVAVAVVVGGWVIVTVVRSIGGPEGKAAGKTLSRRGRRGRR